MGLAEYKRKRHFQRTTEPAGRPATRAGWSFVVQKHDARRLHYDFRLELDGVLKSWAVPKGPSLDPAQKRLAVQVEDHPVEYGRFEGVIPQGEYGGGTVLLWDRGQWQPEGDPRADYERGRLKFKLNGKKLRGGWMLVRTGHARREGQADEWLLFKLHDGEARPAAQGDILEEAPLSVVSGRDLDLIAHQRRRVWSSSRAEKNGHRTARPKPTASPAKQRRRRIAASAIEGTLYDERRQQFAGVRLTSGGKVLYPEQGLTKLDLAGYYREISRWILPHIADRPLVLVRCPEGRSGECFFQKHPRPGTPAALRQVPVRENQKTENYVVVDDVAGLISLAQVGALEVHAWGSRADMLEKPDRLVFDLDPDPKLPWGRVAEAARQVREFLGELGLESFLKTTGGKGLHLVVPIERRHAWDEVKAFCKLAADTIVSADHARFTANMSKSARTNKIFIDYLRNGRGATSVAPYSPRARPGATVSTPLAWDELNTDIRSDLFTIRNLPERLASLRRDPWEAIRSTRQRLSKAINALSALGR